MRKTLFWLHLSAGLCAGIVILIMSVTGVLLMYERQMIAWADRGFRIEGARQTRLDPSVLLERIAAAEGARPESLTLYSDPAAPAEAAAAGRTLFVDPYTGRVLGEGSKSIRTFFRTVTDWHRWLALSGPHRPLGRTITGVANLLFLILVVSGIYLWAPRSWKWPQFRAVLLFRGGLTGKSRDFNWHNVIGIWSAVPLFFVVLGALAISFPWATNLIYRIAGDTPPRPPGPALTAAAERSSPNLSHLDSAWKLAESQAPGWRSIAFRIPTTADAPLTFAIAESHRGRPDKRATVTADSATGRLTAHETFSSFSAGRRWRAWLRFIHTGEALGWIGQTVAGVVSAGGAVLVWTGIALCWRRFRNWRVRAGKKPVEELQEVG